VSTNYHQELDIPLSPANLYVFVPAHCVCAMLMQNMCSYKASPLHMAKEKVVCIAI